MRRMAMRIRTAYVTRDRDDRASPCMTASRDQCTEFALHQPVMDRYHVEMAIEPVAPKRG